MKRKVRLGIVHNYSCIPVSISENANFANPTLTNPFPDAQRRRQTINKLRGGDGRAPGGLESDAPTQNVSAALFGQSRVTNDIPLSAFLNS